jgi:hypothetical protein
LFHTSEEDRDNESDTSSVVHESEPYEKASDFSQPFVPRSMARPRFAFLGVSGVNADFIDEPSGLDCFQSVLMKICGSCLLNKQTQDPPKKCIHTITKENSS